MVHFFWQVFVGIFRCFQQFWGWGSLAVCRYLIYLDMVCCGQCFACLFFFVRVPPPPPPFWWGWFGFFFWSRFFVHFFSEVSLGVRFFCLFVCFLFLSAAFPHPGSCWHTFFISHSHLALPWIQTAAFSAFQQLLGPSAANGFFSKPLPGRWDPAC